MPAVPDTARERRWRTIQSRPPGGACGWLSPRAEAVPQTCPSAVIRLDPVVGASSALSFFDEQSTTRPPPVILRTISSITSRGWPSGRLAACALCSTLVTADPSGPQPLVSPQHVAGAVATASSRRLAPAVLSAPPENSVVTLVPSPSGLHTAGASRDNQRRGDGKNALPERLKDAPRGDRTTPLRRHRISADCVDRRLDDVSRASPSSPGAARRGCR